MHQRQFSSHSTMTRLFGQTTESSHQRQQRMDETQTLRQRREALREQHSWLEEVDKEARGIKSRLSAYGARAAGSERQLEVWLALLGEWEANPPAPLHRDMDELFGRYVHDHLALSEIQRVIRSMTGELFFAIRGFDKP